VATILLTQAVASLDGSPSKEELYAALLTQKEVRTPDHNFQIVDRHIKFPLVVKKILNGKGATSLEG
jgi:hypothetical protein